MNTELATRLREVAAGLRRRNDVESYPDPEEWEELEAIAALLENEPTYTEEQVKEAFVATFHKSGEQWFDDLGTPEECQRSTDTHWQEFKARLATPQQESRNP
jgi:hypothetical protein